MFSDFDLPTRFSSQQSSQIILLNSKADDVNSQNTLMPFHIVHNRNWCPCVGPLLWPPLSSTTLSSPLRPYWLPSFLILSLTLTWLFPWSGPLSWYSCRVYSLTSTRGPSEVGFATDRGFSGYRTLGAKTGTALDQPSSWSLQLWVKCHLLLLDMWHIRFNSSLYVSMLSIPNEKQYFHGSWDFSSFVHFVVTASETNGRKL